MLLLVAVAIALLAACTVAQERVWMKGGDRLSGKILEVKEDKLVLEAATGDTVNLSLEKILSIQSDRPLKLTLTDTTTILEGMLERREDGSAVVGGDNKVMPLTDFRLVKSIEDPNAEPVEPDIWSGKFNASGFITGGNSREKSAHLDTVIEGRWTHTRLTLEGGWDYGESEGTMTTRKSFGSLKGDWFFIEKAYAYARYRAENDKFQDLRIRHTMGAGLGYQVIETESTKFQIEAGASYVIERLDPIMPQPVNRRVANTEGYATADGAAKFRYTVTEGVTFSEDLLAYLNLGDQDDLRLSSKTALDVMLSSTLSLTLQVLWEFDNLPAQGRKRQDTRYLAGITYTFW